MSVLRFFNLPGTKNKKFLLSPAQKCKFRDYSDAIFDHMNALSFLAAVLVASVSIVDGAIDYDVTTLPL